MMYALLLLQILSADLHASVPSPNANASASATASATPSSASEVKSAAATTSAADVNPVGAKHYPEIPERIMRNIMEQIQYHRQQDSLMRQLNDQSNWKNRSKMEFLRTQRDELYERRPQDQLFDWLDESPHNINAIHTFDARHKASLFSLLIDQAYGVGDALAYLNHGVLPKLLDREPDLSFRSAFKSYVNARPLEVIYSACNPSLPAEFKGVNTYHLLWLHNTIDQMLAQGAERKQLFDQLSAAQRLLGDPVTPCQQHQKWLIIAGKTQLRSTIPRYLTFPPDIPGLRKLVIQYPFLKDGIVPWMRCPGVTRYRASGDQPSLLTFLANHAADPATIDLILFILGQNPSVIYKGGDLPVDINIRRSTKSPLHSLITLICTKPQLLDNPNYLTATQRIIDLMIEQGPPTTLSQHLAIMLKESTDPRSTAFIQSIIDYYQKRMAQFVSVTGEALEATSLPPELEGLIIEHRFGQEAMPTRHRQKGVQKHLPPEIAELVTEYVGTAT